jgi:UDP-2,4-diacetamido-2,4,6-trideoxy-beta-L-altropyranose hydrolase
MKPGALLIRADASVAIGTGHVMRCLALAQAWQDAGGTASFAVTELPDALQPRLSSNGFSPLRMETIPGGVEDALATIAQARQLNAEWIVVDGDHFHNDFLDHVRSSGFRVLLLDDFADRQTFPADLIVNPNLGADEELYRKRGSKAPVLTGPRYALLRREFQTPCERRFGEKGNRVLITLGGSDPEELTPRIVTALAGCPDLQLTVVAGAGYSSVNELRELSAPNFKVVFDVQTMAELMSNMDLAIIAAGGTLWELLSVGCAVLSYARNTVQRRVVRSLAKDGVVVDVGDTFSFDAASMVSEVKRLADSCPARERMAALGRALVDGLGAARVVEALERCGAC